jgi:tRNA (adenine57-N1/adenine58-N1)-methyltransferase catalytic subunit
MDFARPLVQTESVASKSKIRYLEAVTLDTAVGDTPEERARNVALDNQVIRASNQIAAEMFLGLPDATAATTVEVSADKAWMLDASHYTERSTPVSSKIKAGDLVVIQESFDKLDFVYCKPGEIYSNRNGNFHHDDFINQPFGTKVRSRDLQGYGFLFLLKPTPELWTRSLNHRTQVVHELDQSQIIFQLHLKPNDVVVESGTGSGAMSHAIIRTIAPAGRLHTYEFNRHRAETARTEFQQHGLSHLVTVHHKDVCRGLVEAQDESNKKTAASVQEGTPGFDLPGQSVDAVFLDLPEPWTAVPHAAHVLQPNARIATYSPCMEQTQRTVEALEAAGFHSIKTFEYRLQEHYVDEVEYESPPTEKRPRPTTHNVANYLQPSSAVVEDTTATAAAADDDDADAEDNEVVSETDNRTVDSSETGERAPPVSTASAAAVDDDVMMPQPTEAAATTAAAVATEAINGQCSNSATQKKRKKLLVARPFVMMRGHTAFITFGTAGNEFQPNPNDAAGAAET